MEVFPSANDAATDNIGISSIIFGITLVGTSIPCSFDDLTLISATSSLH